MHGPVQSAVTEAELLDALILRIADAFDKTKSSRELVSLSGELMKLLRDREALRTAAALDAEAAARDAEAVANATTEEDFREWIASLD